MAKERLRVTLVPLSPVDGGSRAARCCASTSSWRPCEGLTSTVQPPAAPLSSTRPRRLSRSRSVTPSVSPFPGCLLFPQHFHLFQRTLPSPDRLSEGGDGFGFALSAPRDASGFSRSSQTQCQVPSLGRFCSRPQGWVPGPSPPACSRRRHSLKSCGLSQSPSLNPTPMGKTGERWEIRTQVPDVPLRWEVEEQSSF